MLIITTISILVGIVVGLRFKVFILVPTVGLATALVAANGIMLGDGIWRIAATMVIAATLLQLGYVGGSVLRLIIGVARGTDHGRASMPNSAGVFRSGQ